MAAPVDLVELSAFKARTLQWRPARGLPVLTIVTKATFKLAGGIASLAEMQDDVNGRDLHAENNAKKGLHSASDLAPYKPRADVAVVGKAYSPPHELSRVLVARVKVGSMDKRVQVHADRFLLGDGQIKDDKFFSKMGIGYERAFGGADTANPVGIGVEGRPDSRGRVKLPNLQAPGTKLIGPGAKRRPYAFGPIPATWPTRKQFLDGRDISWLEKDSLSRELAADFRWGFFNVCPPDQQVDEIRSDETIHLEHLHPEHPQLDIRLPGLYPCVYMQRANEAHRVAMKGDTLWIDTNRLVLTVTWRAQVPLEGDQGASIRVFVAAGSAQHKPTWDEVWIEAESKKAREAWKANMAPASTEVPTQRRKQTEPLDAPYSSSPRLTSPVPLASPRSDRVTAWLPSAPTSAPSSPPKTVTVPPVSSQPRAVMVELGLNEADGRRLQELCQDKGVEPAAMLRLALRDAYDRRFGR